MKDYINGIVTSINNEKLKIENNGIGYLIEITSANDFSLNKRNRIYVYDYAYVDKLKQNLTNRTIGFGTELQRDFFSRLLQIKGVGINTALRIIRNDLNELLRSINHGDENEIYRNFGINSKIAALLIDEFSNNTNKNLNATNTKLKEIYKVLLGLGYKPNEIALALNQLVSENKPIDQLVEIAIKKISNNIEFKSG
jgi:Holliday junction DNA helicase RuvA subunit